MLEPVICVKAYGLSLNSLLDSSRQPRGKSPTTKDYLASNIAVPGLVTLLGIASYICCERVIGSDGRSEGRILFRGHI